MIRHSTLLAISIAASLMAMLPPANAEVSAGAVSPWERVTSSHGILVERRTVAGSSLKEFRGSGVIDAPVSAILAVFGDIDRATEWMDSCNGSRLVDDRGDREKIVYNRTHATWPVSDRDAVLHNTISIDAEQQRVRIEFNSIDDPRVPPVKGVVRMPFVRGHWYLWPSSDGTRTRVEYQVHASPGGELPAWLVNYVSRELPYKTIIRLGEQTRRRTYPDFAQYLQSHFSEYPFLTRTMRSSL
jgi:hypothetical protein